MSIRKTIRTLKNGKTRYSTTSKTGKTRLTFSWGGGKKSKTTVSSRAGKTTYTRSY